MENTKSAPSFKNNSLWDGLDDTFFGHSLENEIDFLWLPERYSVEWAEIPSDVPTHDWTRHTNGSVNKYYPNLEQVLLENVSKQYAKYGVNAENVEVVFVSNPSHISELLGVTENTSPSVPDAPKLYTSEIDANVATSESTYPIQRNYPRLVLKTLKSENTSTGKEVWRAIADLHKYLNDEMMLKQSIIEVVEQYTVLSFNDIYADSFDGWQEAIKEMYFWHRLIAEFIDAKDVVRRDSNSKGKAEVIDADGVAIQLRTFLTNTQELVPPSFIHMTRLFTRNNDPELSEGQCLEIMSKSLWRNFAGRIHKNISMSVKRPAEFEVNCGSYCWAYYELWKLLKLHGDLKTCKKCGRLFEGHGNQIYCKFDNCYKKQNLQRAKNKQRGKNKK